MITAEMLADATWRDLYPRVEEMARGILACLPDGRTLSTADLGKTIREDAGLTVDTPKVSRILQALAALAVHGMSDCTTLDRPRLNHFKQLVKPVRWHRSRNVVAGPMGRMEAASALASASGHALDDCVLIVAALENSNIHFVKS